MAYTQDQLTALEIALARGEHRVTFAYKTVEYRSAGDLKAAIHEVKCSASRVIITRTGGVGSIGVIALHVDQSVADSKNGLSYTAITAGARKSDYSPHEPLPTEAQARLQAEVNRLYG